MKDKKDEMVRAGYMSASAWLQDSTKQGADVVQAVYLAEMYSTMRERIVGLARDGVYLVDYDPRNEVIVGQTWAKYWNQYGFKFQVSDLGKVPDSDWSKFENGFVMAVRQYFAEMPSGTRIYSKSAQEHLERIFSNAETPVKKYLTTKEKKGDK